MKGSIMKSVRPDYLKLYAITDDGPVILTVDEKGAWCSMEGGVL